MPKPSRFATFRGETRSLTEWSKILGIPFSTLDKRDKMGVPLDQRLRPEPRKPRAYPKAGEPRAKKHPLRGTWQSMLTRCYNPKHVRFKHYGGRGITVFQEWRDDFWAYVAAVEALGPKPEGGTIDRRDNDVGYEPGNIRWATEREQKLNYSGNHLMTWEGETLPISSWAERFGVTYNQFWSRAHWYKYNMAKTLLSVEKLKRTG